MRSLNLNFQKLRGISNIILKYLIENQLRLRQNSLITQQTKSIGEFDFNVYNENIKQIQTELDRHSKI